MDKAKVPSGLPYEQGRGLNRPDGKNQIAVGLRCLNEAQVLAIDRALQEIGDFGEVHLIVNRGRVRFIGKFRTETLEPET